MKIYTFVLFAHVVKHKKKTMEFIRKRRNCTGRDELMAGDVQTIGLITIFGLIGLINGTEQPVSS